MRFLAVALVMLSLVAPAKAQELKIWDTRTGKLVPVDQVIAAASAADVVILGEVHDNPLHHQNQAWIVAQLAPDALVVEMIRAADDERIARHLAAGGTAGEVGPLIGWEKAGWPDWQEYRPIFDALPAGARIYGAALPREEVRRVMSEPASAILQDQRFTPLLDRPLAADLLAELEQEMIDSHCGHLPREMAPMMVSAQRLRDASLSAAVLRARDNGAAHVIMIAGNGHARKDRGVPKMLVEVASNLKVVVIGQIETDGDLDLTRVERMYDFAWTTLPHDRPDPCEELRKRKR